MKTRIKVLVLILALLVGLPALAWTGTFLYWRVRIARAMRALEADPKTFMKTPIAKWTSNEVHVTLEEAKCRALPDLFASLEPGKDPEFLAAALSAITWICLPSPIRENEDRTIIILTTLRTEDAPEVRRRKCEELRGWWKEQGHRYHQGWRIWSSNCRDAREGKE